MTETISEFNLSDGTNAPNVIDLFSGVGGLSLGVARAGFTIRGAVDIEPHAINAHARNFPGAVHMNVDIADLTGQTMKNQVNLSDGELAGIVGGPPCQGFSTIGKRNCDDVRNQSFVEFFRVVSEARPKFFLAENVPGIMRDDYCAIRESAFSFVENEYTLLPPMQLAANEYGAPTTRKRIFFFGFRPDDMEPLTIDSFKAHRSVETVYVKDALCGLPAKINPHWQREEQGWQVVHTTGQGDYAQRLNGHLPLGVGDQTALERLKRKREVSGFLGTLHSNEVSRRYGKIELGKYDKISKSYRLDPDGFCPTLRAGTGPEQGSFQAVRPIHPTEPRVITPREAARLQGFPDWYQFSPTKWHSFRQIGNSVSPILAEELLNVVAKALKMSNKTGEKHGSHTANTL